MPDLTPEWQHMLADVAQRHGFSTEAALVALRALAAQGGTMAQFSHPELGGMGQWSAGGMVMVGTMFDQDLKGRVSALCSDLAVLSQRMEVSSHLARSARAQVQSQGQWDGSTSGVDASTGWWPAELGSPASSGTQNGISYAYFPAARRLAIQNGHRMDLYHTADHRIAGISQQQGDGVHGLTFSSDKGQVRLADLQPVVRAASPLVRVHPAIGAERSCASPQVQPPRASDAASSRPAPSDPLTLIERLAELHRKGVLTEAEFVTKKAELLGRL